MLFRSFSLPINGSWLSSVVTVEERRYGLMTTRLPDLNNNKQCSPVVFCT